MVKKIKLEFEPDYEFLLLGILSCEADYHLVWEINRELPFDFERIGDHSVRHLKTREELKFSCYRYNDPGTYLTFSLMSNRSEFGFLLNQLKNLDYIMVITGEYNSSLAEQLKKQLLGLKSVQGCFILDPKETKNSYRVL